MSHNGHDKHELIVWLTFVLGVLTAAAPIGQRGTSSSPAPVAERTARRDAGSLSFDPALSGIHRLANDGGAVAVSLHVYGVAQEHISTRVNRLYPTA